MFQLDVACACHAFQMLLRGSCPTVPGSNLTIRPMPSRHEDPAAPASAAVAA
jgi:hypothetical protein